MLVFNHRWSGFSFIFYANSPTLYLTLGEFENSLFKNAIPLQIFLWKKSRGQRREVDCTNLWKDQVAESAIEQLSSVSWYMETPVHLGWYFLVISVSLPRTSVSHLVPPWLYFVPCDMRCVLHHPVSLTYWLLVVSANGIYQKNMGEWERRWGKVCMFFLSSFCSALQFVVLTGSPHNLGLLLMPSVPTECQ